MSRFALILLTVFLTTALPARAGIDVFKFDNPEQGQRFQKLSEELRCLVCQNENLADSNADLAHDLRREIHDMILRGESDQQIIDYMVARYGDFVLYRPPVMATTYLLWFGPFLLVAVGLFVLLRLIRKGGRKGAAPLSEDEHERLRELLNENDKPRG